MWQQPKRQRVLRACDECKRKKKQCSGTYPCVNCVRRSRECNFSGIAPVRDRLLDVGGDAHRSSTKRPRSPLPSQYEVPEDGLRSRDGTNPNDSTEDYPPVQNLGRLLQDGEGRLLYLGDSASLSLLQSIRRLVESHLGPSPFTDDSSRHRILEASLSTPSSYRHTLALPDIEAAMYLTDSFFTNTAGLCEVFNKDSFTAKLKETYSRPLDADAQWLCQLNLVFAIGLQMRPENSSQSSQARNIVDRLEGSGSKRSEIFYLAARQLKDPVEGIEDGGVAVVQSLLLMTLYMLASSKRNTAWGYMGMAVNLAYALGIHKEETLPMFSEEEKTTRRNIWQSLYVVDCFLASSLGRPNAINCASAPEQCLDTVVQPPTSVPLPNMNGLLAAAKVSRIIGEILSRVYQKRKASRSIAYTLSLKFSQWLKELPEELHWKRISSENSDPALTLRRLHLNLIYFHGIILLTRPFFQYEVSKQLRRGHDGTNMGAIKPSNLRSQGESARPEQSFCFHGACVSSAVHSIINIHAAFSSGALPRRDHFVVYWLFTSVLILLTNVFCPVYSEPDSESAILMAVELLSFHGETDLQARRYQTIVESFNDVLQAAKKSKQGVGHIPETQNIFTALFGTNPNQPVFEKNAPEQFPQAEIGRGMVAGNWAAGRPEDMYPQPTVPDHSAQFQASAAAHESFDPPSTAMYEEDDSINFDGIWWSDNQDNFTNTSHIQVPLYGLFEPS